MPYAASRLAFHAPPAPLLRAHAPPAPLSTTFHYRPTGSSFFDHLLAYGHACATTGAHSTAAEPHVDYMRGLLDTTDISDREGHLERVLAFLLEVRRAPITSLA